MKLTPQQQAVVDEMAADAPGEHVIVLARAGGGKTSTIVAGLEYVKASRILCAAFAKKNARDFKARIRNPRVESATWHSVGRAIVMANWPGTKVVTKRGRLLAQQATANAPADIVGMVEELVEAAKNQVPLATVEQLIGLAAKEGIAPDEDRIEDGWPIERIAVCARKTMDLALRRDGTMDMTDMIWLPVAAKLARQTYDMVVIDEAQDTNYTQLALAWRVLRKPTGRMIVVGDDRQAIYEWRGADSNALARLKEALKAKELRLTRSFRSAKEIIREAQRLVPDIEALDDAPEGVVRSVAFRQEMIENVQYGDVVLSRVNAPLVPICLKLIKRGVRAYVEGRKLGNGLRKLIANMQAPNIPVLLERLEAWRVREYEKATKLEETAAAARQEVITDTVDCLVALCEDVATVAEVDARIGKLFADADDEDNPINPANVVTLSSVHKAKGLEWPRVWMLHTTFYPRGRTLEEENLEYVAITRAKLELVYTA